MSGIPGPSLLPWEWFPGFWTLPSFMHLGYKILFARNALSVSCHLRAPGLFLKTQFKCHVLSEASCKHPLQPVSHFYVPAAAAKTCHNTGTGFPAQPLASWGLRWKISPQSQTFSASSKSEFSKCLVNGQMSFLCNQGPVPGTGSLDLDIWPCEHVLIYPMVLTPRILRPQLCLHKL